MDLRHHLPSDIKILVVEDFKPFREFIKTLLEKQAHLRVVSAVADGLEALEKSKALNPDLILLDIGLPGLNGIEVARQVSEFVPRPKIVFVTQESSLEVVQEAFKVGGNAYVVKSMAARDLLPAIDAALEDRKFASRELNGRTPSGRNGADPVD